MKLVKEKYLVLILIMAIISVTGCSNSGVVVTKGVTENNTEDNTNQEVMTEPLDSELNVHFINVGQGDSVLLDYGEVELLIDGGDNACESTVPEYIAPFVDGNLDIVVATHPDADHIGGLDAVLNEYQVDLVIDSGYAKDTVTYDDYLTASGNAANHIEDDDMTFTVDDQFTIEIIETGDLYPDANDQSVIVYVSYGDTDFLFTGDAASNVEDVLIERGLEKINVFKAGHHASKYSNSDAFLDVIDPDYVIVSCGIDNSYGHPHLEAVYRFLKHTDEVYTTADNGSIIVTSDGVNLTCDASVPYSITTLNVVDTDSSNVNTGSATDSTTETIDTSAIIITALDKRLEYVTLENMSNQIISLEGYYVLSTRGDQRYYFDESQSMAPGETLTIGGYASKDTVDLIWEDGSGVWNNSKEDNAELYNGDTLICSFEGQ